MNRLLYFLLLVLFSQTVAAQQLSLFTQYRTNQGIINPASVSGDFFAYENNVSFSASYRNQWTGIDNNPTTQTIQGEYFTPDPGGLNFVTGGYLINDQTGPTGFTGIYGRFGTVISENPRYGGISLGLNLGLVQYKVDGSQLRLRDEGDIIGKQNYSQWFPDAGVGAFAYTMLEGGLFDEDIIFGGISVPQVIGLDLSFEDEEGTFNTKRVQHIYLNGGLYHFINDESFLEFSTWMKYAPNAPFNFDMNVRYQMGGNFWGGLGGSSAGNVHLEAGFILGGNLGFTNTVKIGYGYDYSISSFGPYVGPTHELNVAVSLDSTY